LNAERIDTVIIGGGQAGLAVGYFLKEQGREFVILDAGERIGNAWRRRWDSLRLFTPAALSGLPGMPLPFPGGYFPTKDETADYLENYAAKFNLPVRLGRHVDSLRREGGGYLVSAGEERYLAGIVVVATGPYHTPRIPDFAGRLDPSIAQLHSSAYRNPDQIPEGDVLVVGAGNSGAEISLELSATRRIYLSGRDTGNVPGGVHQTRLPRHLLFPWLVGWWIIGHLTADTRLGQKGREFTRTQGAPLVRFSPDDLTRAGVERVLRVEGVAEGKPRLADGRILDVASVVWATGFRPDFGWIELPVFGEDGYPNQHRGVVEAALGLYFLGLPFQHTFFSATVGGVGKDARYIAEHVAEQATGRNSKPAAALRPPPHRGPEGRAPRAQPQRDREDLLCPHGQEAAPGDRACRPGGGAAAHQGLQALRALPRDPRGP
jgi:putative flavoprotein involved in K+ transport